MIERPVSKGENIFSPFFMEGNQHDAEDKANQGDEKGKLKRAGEILKIPTQCRSQKLAQSME